MSTTTYTAQVVTNFARISKIPGLKMAHLELALEYSVSIPVSTPFAKIISETFFPKNNFGLPMVFKNSSNEAGLHYIAVNANGNIMQGATSSLRSIVVDGWYPIN